MKKSLLIAIGSAVFASGLSVIGCRLAGMRSRDLVIAALVSLTISLMAAIAAVYLVRGKTTDHPSRP
jgi:hypothetical protein